MKTAIFDKHNKAVQKKQPNQTKKLLGWFGNSATILGNHQQTTVPLVVSALGLVGSCGFWRVTFFPDLYTGEEHWNNKENNTNKIHKLESSQKTKIKEQNNVVICESNI